MNTILSSIYLKICQIDPRHIRLVLLIFAFAAGGVIRALPIHGDVGG